MRRKVKAENALWNKMQIALRETGSKGLFSGLDLRAKAIGNSKSKVPFSESHISYFSLEKRYMLFCFVSSIQTSTIYFSSSSLFASIDVTQV